MKLRHVVVATVAASCLQGASAFKVTKLDKSVGKGALAQSRKYGIPTVQEIRQVSKTFAPKSKGLRKSERNAWEKSAEGKTKKKVNGKFAKNEMDAIRAAADANTDPAAPTIVGKEVEMGDVPEVHEDGIVELECPEGSDGMRIHYKWTGLGFPVVNVIDEEEVYTYNALEGYSDLTAGNAVEVELINTEILSYGCAAFPTGSTGARRRLLNTESCYGASDNADCVDNFNCASKNMDATPLENAKKAVARMLFSNENGDWLVCTGWLINGPADKVVFGTAYHCISSQAQAESLQVRFFFDAECGECYGDYATASAIGADIVAAIPETDFTLLTLRGDAPEGTVALGYNVDDMVDGETYYRLHHPGGNVLAYSESVYVHEPPATCGAGWENENFAYTIPSQGGVLSGSSGSALLNSAGQIVGQLKGVCAGSNWCDFGATKHVDGRFSESFPAIAAWLGNSAAPTVVPTVAPTNAPTVDPTDAPTTLQPTNAPTVDPTDAPTVVPTVAPTNAPTGSPTTEEFRAVTLAHQDLEAHAWTTGVIGDVAYKCHDSEGCYENTVAERSKFVVATTEVDKSQLDPETQHNTTDGSFTFSTGGIVFVSTDGLEEYHFPHDCQCSGVTPLASTVEEALEGYFPTDAPSDAPTDTPTASPSDAPTPDCFDWDFEEEFSGNDCTHFNSLCVDAGYTSAGSHYDSNGVSASEACCGCGGGARWY